MALTITTLQLLLAGAGLIVLTATYKGIYNLYFHPLAKFPGPRIAAVSHTWYAKHILTRNLTYAVRDAHAKYGGVVRIAPDELSFATFQSWKDIYGHAVKGHSPFLKGRFYRRPDVQTGIVFERDPAIHREVRRNLSYAFSAKSLQGQEAIVQHYVNMFVAQIKKLGTGERGINAAEWFNWLTFDVIGDLSFGDSFGAVENAKTHFWISLILNSTFASCILDLLVRFPTLGRLLPKSIIFKKAKAARKIHLRFVEERVASRMAKANDRPDFFSHLLSDKASNLSQQFLKAQAHVLIIAGSETTATTLTAMAYYVTKNPDKFARLSKEVRQAFTSEAEIDDKSSQGLPYLHAVIEECLRLFPPVSIGLPRISPGAEVDGYYVPAGYNVSTQSYSVMRSKAYFHDPENFLPERWLPQDHEYYSSVFASDKLDASKPFSTGPRVCLGINLAYMELRISIAKLVWNFDWELVNPDMGWRPAVATIWEKPVTMVRFKPVEHAAGVVAS